MLRELAARCALVAALILPVGCASTYYDPLAPVEARTTRVADARGRSLEQTYRLVYERLEACYGSGYHVQPRFERARGEAWIMLVSGLGLNRYSLIGNRFEARVDLRDDGTRVTVEVTHRDPPLQGLARQVERWLSGAPECVG